MQVKQLDLQITYISSPNIALVKYWGKYNQQHIIPRNTSLGVTLDPTDLRTTTHIKFHKTKANKLILNKQQLPISKRIEKMLTKTKNYAYFRKYSNIQQKEWQQYNFQIHSQNSFPTASGLASSASGLACLAASLNGLFSNIFTSNQLSELARIGSGSASRSLLGGLVIWKGIPQSYLTIKTPTIQQINQLSQMCISNSIYSPQELSFMEVLIVLANDNIKQISSTVGMEQSVKTSQLIQYRNVIATKRCQLIINIIHSINTATSKQEQYELFNVLAQNIIQDSNQFHAICLDTYPPILYLNQFSKQIIYIVDHILNPKLKAKVAYTFDAGPHAFLFIHTDYLPQVFSYLKSVFNIQSTQLNDRALQIQTIPIGEYDFKEYKGEIIHPYGLWATKAGKGATQLKNY